MSNAKPIVSVTTPNGPLVDVKTGLAVFSFLKWIQNVGQLLNQVFDNQGALSPDSIPFPTANALGGVTTAGPTTSQWINEIDGQGVPHLKQPAYSDLAGSLPNPSLTSLGGVNASTVQPNQFVTAIGTSGAPQTAQPAFADLSGVATPGQIPNLSDLNGQITEAQLPSAGLTVTITTAKLTVAGSEGSMAFTNGILTGQVQAT